MFYSDYIAQDDLNALVAPALRKTAEKLSSKWNKCCDTLDRLEALPTDPEIVKLISESNSDLETITMAQAELKYLESIEYNNCGTLKGIKQKLQEYLSLECRYELTRKGRELATGILLKELA